MLLTVLQLDSGAMKENIEQLQLLKELMERKVLKEQC